MFKDAANKVRSLLIQLKNKGWRYWAPVFGLLILGTILGMWLGERYVWIRMRYAIYGWIQNATRVTNPAKNTVVVLIDDEEYWKGELARRAPLNRDYLAKLLTKLATGAPATIALDSDLRSPVPERGTQELEAYRVETENLLQTIKTISQKHDVVLATTIRREGAGFTRSPNVFDDYDFGSGRVSHGYVTLPHDLRQVPLSVPVKNRAEREDSFAGAIAKTREETMVRAAEQQEHRGFPYGSFYVPKEFRKEYTSKILNADERELLELLKGRVVIVGGAWHTGSYKGPIRDEDYSGSVDLHFTPAGEIPGAFVHANYVEALLSGSALRQMPKPVVLGIEIFCSLLVAIAFALEGSLRRKFGRVLLLSIALVGISYMSWQNLGLYFDFFIPILLLSFHAPIEQLRETRTELRRLRERVKELEKDNPEPTPGRDAVGDVVPGSIENVAVV